MARPKAEHPTIKHINLHLTEPQRRQLEEIAVQERRPVGQLVRVIVQEYIAARSGSQQFAAISDNRSFERLV